MASAKFHNTFRQYHRWIGFFLAGIMFVYALSGTLLIFRNTDFLKYEQTIETNLKPGLSGQQLGPQLRMRDFKVVTEDATHVGYPQGRYDKATGVAVVNTKDYPPVLAKMVKLHKATTNSPLFFLNIFFGMGLLFFVISAFLMFMPKIKLFKDNLKIAGAGFVFALLVIIFGS